MPLEDYIKAQPSFFGKLKSRILPYIAGAAIGLTGLSGCSGGGGGYGNKLVFRNLEFSISPNEMYEGDSGTTIFPVTVNIWKIRTVDVDVTLEARAQSQFPNYGWAKDGVDFMGITQTLTIPAGQSSATMNVIVYGDSDPEPDEMFMVQLISASVPTHSGPGNSELPIQYGQVILNDD